METTAKGHPMHPPKNPTFTPARIVALALIGLAVLGLAWLRFGPGDDRVSVPKGAHAGQLTLHACTYTTEDGSYAADCGTLVVPENRADADSRLIALPLTRIHARAANPGEPIFRLEGGPGITNMTFPKASWFAGTHDVVLVGYRGVDGSVRLDCPEVESAVASSTDVLEKKAQRAYADGFRACAERLSDDGVDLAGYTIAQRADDLEAARVALGYDRVDLLSESAGTRTALVYSWRHPGSVNRSVMIGANPPGHLVWDAKTTDEQIRRYAELCARDESCSGRTDDLVATLERTADDMPDRWLFLPIEDGNVRTASFYGLMETSAEAAPLNAPLTFGSWIAADDGDASGFWLQSLMADFALPRSFVWGELAAFGRADAQAAREYFASDGEQRSILGNAPSEFIWGGGRMVDAWPASPDEDEYSRMRTSNVETLVIGGELDITTPPQVAAKELMPYLPNGRQVVLEGFAHTVDFWGYQPEAGTRLVNTFLASGKVNDSLYEPQPVDFTPSVGQPAMAKIAAGSILGVIALAALSLIAMSLRVHRRGHVGRKAAALLRSVYPVVLGLGGWLAGVLVAITTMPAVALDDELLAALSVGVPVGLGVYLAWVHRSWSTETKLVGLAAAAAGSLAGAWLGFHATVDMLALATAIVGATAGANLALILFAISRARAVDETTEVAVHSGPGRAPTVAGSR